MSGSDAERFNYPWFQELKPEHVQNGVHHPTCTVKARRPSFARGKEDFVCIVPDGRIVDLFVPTERSASAPWIAEIFGWSSVTPSVTADGWRDCVVDSRVAQTDRRRCAGCDDDPRFLIR
jgi:hypothetical protein